MSTFAVLTALSLFSGRALAQVYAPNCQVSWRWTFNSLGQDPCLVSAYLESTCNGGAFSVPALQPGYSYTGPSTDGYNLCKCNTVVYSLLSACDACQGEAWISWSLYSQNCTTVYPASSHTLSFPNPVPSGTRVPAWALIDITTENSWNSNQSYASGDTPEVAPGALIGSAASSAISGSTASIFSSPTYTSPPSSSSGKSSSNVGAIAGGVAGGVVAVSAAALLLFFFLRRRRPPVYDGAPPPLMGQVQSPPPEDGSFMSPSLPMTPATPMKLYDPNDPTTFPGYQGTSPALAAEDYTEVPNVYTGSTLATVASTQPSRPPGYHGLPTV
ncbi:hypothetical protein BGW80DRAFT_1252422 [Lactifluus volemus]|nr:hypothetical protein BGW80DRAFT_1252422 [Lactifluus volemus]